MKLLRAEEPLARPANGRPSLALDKCRPIVELDGALHKISAANGSSSSDGQKFRSRPTRVG